MDDHQETGQEQQPSHSDEQSPNPGGEPDFELVTVTYRGKSWNVPKDRGRWDMNVQFEFEEGNTMRGFTLLLGGVENFTKTRNEIYEVCKTQDEFNEFKKYLTEVLNKECVN